MKKNLNILAAEEHVDDGDPKVLQLPNDADPLAIEVCLEDIERIDLNFPKFTDGRAYSQARLLRERLGYRGGLRATGAVFLDQLPFMLRCGFDSFEVTNAPTLRALEAGQLPGSPLHYQPSSAHDEAGEGTRPWLRVTRPPPDRA